MAISKCPFLTLSNVMFWCQNLTGKSKYHMRRKWLLSLSWSQHTHGYGRDCWLQNITFICTCVCVICASEVIPFFKHQNSKSKKHLDNNIIASSAMKGFALPNKDMVIRFLVLFYNVFHLWKIHSNCCQQRKHFWKLQTFFSEILRSFWFILSDWGSFCKAHLHVKSWLLSESHFKTYIMFDSHNIRL